MEQVITLDHGSGGKKTSALIDELILPLLQNDALCELGDGAVLNGGEKLVFSTDSFVVTPYFFPGGDIGKLSVCGTVNDVAMSGGEPKYLSLSLILEEGLDNRFARHLEMAEVVRAWAKKYFALFSDERYLSNTLTTIANTRGINVSDLNKKLAEYGYEISNGYGALKEKTFRIAHMADMDIDTLQGLLRKIEEILGL